MVSASERPMRTLTAPQEPPCAARHEQPERHTVRGIDHPEALLNIREDSFRVVERGVREFHVTRAKFLPRIVDQAEGHIHVGFNEVHENPVGSVMVRCVCHVVRVQFAVREILYGL